MMSATTAGGAVRITTSGNDHLGLRQEVGIAADLRHQDRKARLLSRQLQDKLERHHLRAESPAHTVPATDITGSIDTSTIDDEPLSVYPESGRSQDTTATTP
jgi:hypothetical protein